MVESWWLFAVFAAIVVTVLVLVWRRPSSVVRHPWVVLALTFCASGCAALNLFTWDPLGTRIALDSSEEPMMSLSDPARPGYLEAVRNFGADDVYVVGVETDGVFSSEHLTSLREISNSIRRLPGVRRTESLVDVNAYRYVEEDGLVDVSSFIADIPTDAASLESLRARAVEDPIFPKTIVSRDARTAAINVSFLEMTDGEFVASRLDEQIAAILDEHSTANRVFFVTGRQHIKARTHHLMAADLQTLIPLAVLVGAGVAWLVTGSLRSGLIPVGASLIATLWTFGVMAFLGFSMNLITLVLAPTLICVGSVYGVHVLARFDSFAAESSIEDPRGSVALRCLEYTRLPIAVAGLTTCVGFAALAVSDTPSIRELGLFCVFGVVSITVLSLTAMPCLLSVLPQPRAARGVATYLDAVLKYVSVVSTRYPSRLLLAWGATALVAACCLPRIVVDTDYLTFFDQDSDVVADFTSLSEKLVGAMPIYLTVEGGGEGAFRDPVNLRALERLQSLVDEVEGVSATISVVDFVKILNQAIELGDPAHSRIPDTRGEVAEVLFMIPKTKLRAFANTNHSRVNLLVRTGWSGSAKIRRLERGLQDAIAQAELPPTLKASVTGNTIILNHAADGIAGNQLRTVGLATITIFLLMSGIFRSWKMGVLAMIPNVVPVLLFFGAMGAGFAVLSLPTSLIGCIALGIAVDDTAHFLVGYRTKRAVGLDSAQAAAACVRDLGKPIILTSLMLVAGFCVLSLSSFATLREFGYLCAFTMLLCLAADLVLLPAVLVFSHQE